MKKTCCLVMTLLLLFSAALADWELTAENVGNIRLLDVFPLDVHDVIVKSRDIDRNTWHVGWYRDGQLFRELKPSGAWESQLRLAPDPVVGRDGLAGMLCYTPEGLMRYTVDNLPWGPNALAWWTGKGLENVTPLAEFLKASPADNRMILYEHEDYLRVWYDGKDTYIRRDLAAEILEGYHSGIPLADGVFLFRIRHREESSGEWMLVCVDHGEERWRIPMPNTGTYAADGMGGFFCQEWNHREKYVPVKIWHYDGNGARDRVLELKGDRVIVNMDCVYTEEDGTLTLYGSAVANSRGVYSVFALTLDGNLNVTGIDVRKTDPRYKAYNARTCLAPDGSAWTLVYDPLEPGRIAPQLIPFRLLEEDRDDHDLSLRVSAP